MTPNRIIKDSILTSPTLSNLSIGAFGHFFCVLLLSDDWGCLECTPAVLAGACYSLRKGVGESRVKAWNEDLEKAGIIKRWKVGGREFALFSKFDAHNLKYCVTGDGKPTRHRRKTPEPPKSLFRIV